MAGSEEVDGRGNLALREASLMEKFPVKSYEGFEQKVLEGVTIYKNKRRWIALVVVETPYGRRLKLYAWVRRRDGSWKVDLVNLNIGYWDFKKFASSVEQLLKRHKISRQEESEEEPNDEDPTVQELQKLLSGGRKRKRKRL
jgi:hypothetical protein